MTPTRLAEIRLLLAKTPAIGTVPASIAAELLVLVDELREPDEPEAPPPPDPAPLPEGVIIPAREYPLDRDAPHPPRIPDEAAQAFERVIGPAPCIECGGAGYIRLGADTRIATGRDKRVCPTCRGWA